MKKIKVDIPIEVPDKKTVMDAFAECYEGRMIDKRVAGKMTKVPKYNKETWMILKIQEYVNNILKAYDIKRDPSIVDSLPGM